MTSIKAAGGSEIRRLVAADWAVLRQVRLAALADTPYAFSSTLERELSLDERQWRAWIASAAYFMAWRDGQPAGLAAGLPGAGDAWRLVSMWVSPQARGSGIADGLVQAVCACAQASGAALISLWVTDVNARAWAFYRRMGFASTGARQLVRPQEPDHWEEQVARQLG